jgi:hypothetical protein
MSDRIAVRHESRPARWSSGMKPEFRSAQSHRPRYHPELERLEGRALMSYGGSPDLTFGTKGSGMTLPAPGDYDGSGHTEVAGYEPATGTFTYLPAGGGPAVSEQFGPPGGVTIPFSLAEDAAMELGIGAGSGSPSAEIPLTPDVLDLLAGPTAKKKAGQG